MTYTASQLGSLPGVISAPRFATYLTACGNDRARALELYEWNLATSAAFVVPLQITEVAIRNAVAGAIERVHGSDWPRSQGFRIALGKRKQGYDPQKDLERTVRTLKRDKVYTPGKVVAEARFAFWQEMFTARHDNAIWNSQLNIVLPNAPIPNVQKCEGGRSVRSAKFGGSVTGSRTTNPSSRATFRTITSALAM